MLRTLMCLCCLFAFLSKASSQANKTVSASSNKKTTPASPKLNKDPRKVDAESGEPAQSTERRVFITGNFSTFAEQAKSHAELKAALYGEDGLPVDIAAKAYIVDGTHATVSYQATGNAQPVMLFIGINQPDEPFAFLPVKPSDMPPLKRLVLSGDFCEAIGTPGKTTCASKLIVTPDDTAASPQITGFLYGADGTGFTPIMVHQLRADSVDIEFTAELSFRPTWVHLDNGATRADKGGARTFAYVPATPSVATDAVYRAVGLDKLCSSPSNDAKNSTSCGTGKDLAITPLMPSTATVSLLSRQEDLLFMRIVGHAGELPRTLSILLSDGKSTRARLVTKPASEQSLLGIEMTIMDQETVRKNYGARIAEHYLAVKLDVANRSAKKLSFNKSAVWFDVDYRAVSGQYKPSTHNLIANATLDLVPYRVYDTRFATKDGTVYEYGVHQNDRVFADGYKTILNSFDYTIQKTDRVLRYVELLGGVLTQISTGGIVAQVGNTAFRDSIAILTGNFLPGFRAATLDAANIDRLRSNLVNDTLQDTVQLTPNGHASTIMLLPRDGIFAMEGYEDIVVIDRVLDVHIDPDVLNGVKDPPVPIGHLELGYTKDQVRQSLGEPVAVGTNADLSSSFSYSAGAYKTVNFSESGLAISWTELAVAEQIKAAATLAAAKTILSSHGISYTELTLLNKNHVLVDVDDVPDALQYDSAGKHMAADYTLLYAGIRKHKGDTRTVFETALSAMRLDPVGGLKPITAPVNGTKTLNYQMPDVKDGTIVATFSGPLLSKNKSTDPAPTITDISFGGSKPLFITDSNP